MGLDILLLTSPFLFSAMSLYIYLELLRIRSFVKMWELENLSLIPILICMLYLWIGIFNPNLDVARLALRGVIGISLGISMHVVYSYSKKLRKGAIR